jgi:hypothetical protein
MKKTFAFIFHLFLLIPCLAGAQDYALEIEGRYWQPRLNSVVDMLNGTIKSRVNLVKDLGFEEKKDSGEVRIHYRLSPNHKIHLSYLPLEWKSDSLLQTTARLNGETYSVGTRVRSHLELNFIKVGYEWDFLTKESSFLGATMDVLILDLHTSFKEPEFAMEQDYDVTFPAPLLGFAGKWNFAKWMSFSGKVSGIYAGGYGFVLDAEGGLDFVPLKWLVLSGGYRFLDLKGGYKEYQGDYRLHGPFAAMKLRF